MLFPVYGINECWLELSDANRSKSALSDICWIRQFDRNPTSHMLNGSTRSTSTPHSNLNHFPTFMYIADILPSKKAFLESSNAIGPTTSLHVFFAFCCHHKTAFFLIKTSHARLATIEKWKHVFQLYKGRLIPPFLSTKNFANNQRVSFFFSPRRIDIGKKVSFMLLCRIHFTLFARS